MSRSPPSTHIHSDAEGRHKEDGKVAVACSSFACVETRKEGSQGRDPSISFALTSEQATGMAGADG